MERIAHLVFAATALFLFCVGIIFAMNVFAGNGGEYWGFDGQIDPWHAADYEFEAGDRRFLAYELTTVFGETRRGFHAPSEFAHVRFNEIPARHGYDSVRKAHEFARSYNDWLAFSLQTRTDAWCEPSTPR